MIDTQNYVPQSQSTSFSAFPADRQQELARVQADKLKSIAHLPHPVDIPGMPKMPSLQPIDPRVQDQRVQHQNAARPAVQYHPPQPVEQQADMMFQQAAQRAPMPAPAFAPQAPAPQMMAQMPVHQPQRVAPNLVQNYVNQVASHNPGIINPVADAEYSSVELPSRFAYYGFTDLYVCPFRAKHLGKLRKANSEQSLLAMVEAVSAVCYTSTPGYEGRPMAFDLTLPDFFFVLYWLRLNSFTKSNYVHNTMCEDKKHVERVGYTLNAADYDKKLAAGEITVEERAAIANAALKPESLRLSQIITNTSMKLRELETVPDASIYQLADAPDLIMRPPTMRDVLDFADAPQMKDPEQRTEFAFLAQLATHVQHRSGYLTLAQRIDIIGECSADQVELIKDFESQLKDYGVEETVRIQCKECGAVSETKLSLAAHSFFPFE